MHASIGLGYDSISAKSKENMTKIKSVEKGRSYL